MDVKPLLRILSKYKWLLALLPVVSAVLTFFLVRKMPDSYTSHSRISTGIIDNSAAVLSGKDVQENQANLVFNNLLQTLTLKKVMDQVSYQLVIHDLKRANPYRPNNLLKSLSAIEKQHAIAVLERKYAQREELGTSPGETMLYNMIGAMKYDNETLQKKIIIMRANNSDFIDLTFESDNPELSASVLNILCTEFINYYNEGLNRNNRNAVYFLDSMLQKKHLALEGKMAALQSYKVRNGILDVNDQAGNLINQISDFEAKRQEAFKNITAYKGALNNIESKFNPNDRKYFESSVTKLNQDILTTRSRLSALNNEYIKSNFDPKYKHKVDSVQNVLSNQVAQVNDSYSYNPTSSKQELVNQKLNLEVSLELAKNSVSSLDEELGKLNGRLYKLVPNQAAIKRMQDDIDLATNEYTDLSKKYEQTNMDVSFVNKIKQVEMARPGPAANSKKLLFVIGAGIVTLVLSIMFLFIRFYFDNSIYSSKDLANKTKQPVLGSLNLIDQRKLDLTQLWEEKRESGDLQYFKSLLRTIRFEIDNTIKDSKVIAVTSLSHDAGKTFFAVNLAYAYNKINKKVLLIDGNFEMPEITAATKTTTFIEDIFRNASTFAFSNNSLTILGNKGGDQTLMELFDKATIQKKLEELKGMFDLIIIETASLDRSDKAKEWMPFVEKVIPVFSAAQAISGEQKAEVEYLSSLNGKLSGWVLNKVETRGIKVKVKPPKAKGASA